MVPAEADDRRSPHRGGLARQPFNHVAKHATVLRPLRWFDPVEKGIDILLAGPGFEFSHRGATSSAYALLPMAVS
jgi:hypothetical protein